MLVAQGHKHYMITIANGTFAVNMRAKSIESPELRCQDAVLTTVANVFVRSADGAGPGIPGRRWASRLLLLASLLWPAAPTRAEEIVLVTNPATNATVPLPRNTLYAVFGMRLNTWPDGSPVKVFVLPDDDPVYVAFCKQVLRVFPHQMRSAWDRLVYSGTGQAPIEVSSEEEMRSRVATTPGAIGALTRKMIDDRVKVLALD